MKLPTYAVPAFALAACVTSLNLGCVSHKPTPAASALDIAPAPPAYTPAYSPAYTPAPSAAAYGPAFSSTPAPLYTEATASPTPAASGASGSGSSHTVQKGDTLYKLARERYGDPKQWSRIAAANPGIDANSLKVGQKIVIP